MSISEIRRPLLRMVAGTVLLFLLGACSPAEPTSGTADVADVSAESTPLSTPVPTPEPTTTLPPTTAPVTTATLAAEPPATEPPAPEPPATEPPATEPPATDPPATEPPATEPPATEPPAPEPPAEKCDPSYPGVCIPPAPPDLNCGDIEYKDFKVQGEDPHGFDREGDGLGCES